MFGIEDKTKHILGIPDAHSLEASIVNIIDAYIMPKVIPEGSLSI